MERCKNGWRVLTPSNLLGCVLLLSFPTGPTWCWRHLVEATSSGGYVFVYLIQCRRVFPKYTTWPLPSGKWHNCTKRCEIHDTSTKWRVLRLGQENQRLDLDSLCWVVIRYQTAAWKVVRRSNLGLSSISVKCTFNYPKVPCPHPVVFFDAALQPKRFLDDPFPRNRIQRIFFHSHSDGTPMKSPETCVCLTSGNLIACIFCSFAAVFR